MLLVRVVPMFERPALIQPAKPCKEATDAKATRDTTRWYTAMFCACSSDSALFRIDQEC